MDATHRRGQRQVAWAVVLLLSLTLVMVQPLEAEAGPPVRDSWDSLLVECEVGDLRLSVYGTVFDGAASMEVFVATPDSFAFGFSEAATIGDASMAGSVKLFREGDGLDTDPGSEEDPDVFGTAHVDVTLVADGPSETFEDRFKDGNVLVRFADVFTTADVNGTIVLEQGLAPGITLEGSDCWGQVFSSTVFATNPATYVDRFDYLHAECRVEGPEDATGYLFAFSNDDFQDIVLELDTSQGFVFGYANEVVFTQDMLAAEFSVYRESREFEDGGGELPDPEPVDTAVVKATLTPGESVRERSQSPRETIRMDIQGFAVDGTVEIESDIYELVDCQSGAVSGFVRFTSVSRGGRPATNDAIEDAALLPVPGSVSVSTSRTAHEAEASCTTIGGEGDEAFEYDLPMTNTVWYVIKGTGGPVTVDTAGSDFDTIIGVYDTELAQVACVDDVDSLQARVTFDTQPDRDYLVQIGGYGGSTGRLEVQTASEEPPAPEPAATRGRR